MPGVQADGGSGYNAPDSWVNTLKTGSLIQQMVFTGDTLATPRVQRATAFPIRHWNDPDISPPIQRLGWVEGQREVPLPCHIHNNAGLDSAQTRQDRRGRLYNDFETAIVEQQEAQGSWLDFTEFEEAAPIPRTLTTAWALLTLEKASPHAAPYPSAPVGGLSLPVNKLGLLASYLVLVGLAAALAAARRNRRRRHIASSS
jgi:hypothetical protein